MGKLTTKKKIAVFISGRGSNLKSLIKNSKLKKSKFKIHLVISNKQNAKGINYAKFNKIKSFAIEKKLKEFENKSYFKPSILLRKFDDAAKRTDIKMKSIHDYEKLLSSKLI